MKYFLALVLALALTIAWQTYTLARQDFDPTAAPNGWRQAEMLKTVHWAQSQEKP